MRQEPERKPEPHPTRGETATPPALNVTKKQQTYGSGQRKKTENKNAAKPNERKHHEEQHFQPDHQRQPHFR